MEDDFILFIKAIKSNNVQLASGILKDNPRLIIGKRNFHVIKSINSPKMTSAILKLCGCQLIKHYMDNRISVLAHALKERKALKIIKEIVLFNKKTINQASYDGLTPLIYAVKMNKGIKVIKYLISENGDVNKCNVTGQSPLHFASTTFVLKLLIKSGANVNCVDISGSTPLMTLMKHNVNKEMLFHLLRHGTDTNLRNVKGQTALHLALEYGLDCDIVMEIVNKIDAIHLNSEDEYSLTPLCYALKNYFRFTYKNLIFELIDKGCEVNKNVFMLAVKYVGCHGDSKIIKKLIDYVVVKDCIDSSGKSVLHLVHDANLVNLLVRKGALINHRSNKGVTPLIEVVNCCNDIKLIDSLLSHGADVNEIVSLFINDECNTLFMTDEIVDLFVLHGMNVCLNNEDTLNIVSNIIMLGEFIFSNHCSGLSLLKHIFISNENIITSKLLSKSVVRHLTSFTTEIHKMKRINIIDTVSFYDFCLSKYKSKRYCIDKSNCEYVTNNYKKIQIEFPTFFAQVIVKIKMNYKIHKRKELLKKLLCLSVKYYEAEPVNNYVKKLQNSANRRAFYFNYAELNGDCLYNVGQYLLNHELSCLLAVSM